MSEIVVRADNLGKLYRIRQREPYYTLRDAIAHAFTFRWFHHGQVSGAAENVSAPKSHSPSANGSSRSEFIWALKDIGFEVKRGEVVGIIGRNGAGKSTLLKVLSGITEPTQGCAQIRGRLGSLLEVGTGFHPELTGRENIYLNGAILGMKKAEISRKFDEIVAFAEIEKFLDTPVKHYSSGMYMRLAFSVAAHLEPEILLVDEVLAVGDAAFQRKCLGKMGDVAKEGRTVLFISHNMGAISQLCTSVLLLDQGRQLAKGKVMDGLETYLQLDRNDEHRVRLPEDPSLPCSVVELGLYNGHGLETGEFDIGEDIILSITYRVTAKLNGFQVAVTLSRNMVDLAHSFDTDQASEIPPREPGRYQAQYRIPKMFLKAGIYSIRVVTGTWDRRYQDLESLLRFEVAEKSVNTQMKGYRKDRPGQVIPPGLWQTVRLDEEYMEGGGDARP